MKKRIVLIISITTLISMAFVSAQEIPIENFPMKLQSNTKQYNKSILENEINGISVVHCAITGNAVKKESLEEGYKYIYLFIKGNGNVKAGNENYDIVPETILLPNILKNISITVDKNDTLHFIKMASVLTEQDYADLETFPKENTQKVYYAKFTDCEAYTEAIKSPKTVSRTILPNKYIPRIAMGTVETTGPDRVDPHEHPMLEQLFLGLAGNQIIVYADDASVDFPEYSMLHIPLGSSHSSEVHENEKMYYVWMDFFMDKKGEEWLKNHKAIEEE